MLGLAEVGWWEFVGAVAIDDGDRGESRSAGGDVELDCGEQVSACGDGVCVAATARGTWVISLVSSRCAKRRRSMVMLAGRRCLAALPSCVCAAAVCKASGVIAITNSRCMAPCTYRSLLFACASFG